MKSTFKSFAVLLIIFITVNANAQNKSTQATTVCSVVQADKSAAVSKNEPLVLYMQDSVSNRRIAIVFPQTVIKKMNFDPQLKLVNQKACISGIIKSYNNQPAIIIDNAKQVNITEPPAVDKTGANTGGK